MNTNMTGFGWLSTIVGILVLLTKNSLSIEKVNGLNDPILIPFSDRKNGNSKKAIDNRPGSQITSR